MGSVIAGGPGLVAVGSTGLVEGVFEEAVWTSPDGISWTLLPQSPDVNHYGCSVEMSNVTDGGFGLVAVGHVGDCSEEGAALEGAAVWHD